MALGSRRAAPVRRRSALPAGRGQQAIRLLMLVRWLARQDRWVAGAEILELYPPRARRTAYRDLEALRGSGVPLEHDETLELGWRLSRAALRRWLDAEP